MTASGSDQDPFFDKPEAYATPMWEVRTLSSPQASTNTSQTPIRHDSLGDKLEPCTLPSSRILAEIEDG